ncbi:MAG: hypothetical protein ACRD29_11985 [Acidimicrobiales bacterium]
MTWRPIAEVPVDTATGRVFEHGWQSWSPTTTYPVTATSHRPARPEMQVMCYRPERPGPAHGFQGEGLLAVDPGTGDPVRVFAARDDLEAVPSIRAELVGDRLAVTTTGSGDAVSEVGLEGSLDQVLGTWADGFLGRAGVRVVRPAPTVWCSWWPNTASSRLRFSAEAIR